MFELFKRLQNADPRVKKALSYVGYLTVVVVLFGLAWISANSGVSQDTQDLNPVYPNTTLIILQTVSKIVILLALMFILFVALRKWQTRRQGNMQKRLSVIETIRFSQRQAVHLIRVDSRQFLIGATDQCMSLLSEVDQSEQTDGETVINETFPGSYESYVDSILDPLVQPLGKREGHIN